MRRRWKSVRFILQGVCWDGLGLVGYRLGSPQVWGTAAAHLHEAISYNGLPVTTTLLASAASSHIQADIRQWTQEVLHSSYDCLWFFSSFLILTAISSIRAFGSCDSWALDISFLSHLFSLNPFDGISFLLKKIEHH